MSNPVRATSLRAEVIAAIADLDLIRSSDAAAMRAIHAVRLTTMTLEEFWLPALPERTAANLDG